MAPSVPSDPLSRIYRRQDAPPESAGEFGRFGSETLAASGPIRSRARHYVANNPWAANGVGALVAGLTGTGITPASAHADPAARSVISSAWVEWSRVADADRRTDVYGFQAAATRALIIDGEAFIHVRIGPNGVTLRLIAPEMVDESDTRELADGGWIIAGVEFNAAGERVAYHVFRERPTAFSATTSRKLRIPASDIVHLMQSQGPGQVRGVSWLAPVLLRLRELDSLEDALVVGVKVAALHAGFLTDMNGTAADSPFDGVRNGSVLESGLEPGTLRYLPSGWDIKFSTPQQAQQTSEFVSHQIRAIAAGLGIPAHLASGDLRQANYGSLRAGMIAFRQRLEQVQFGTLIPQMCQPIYERAITAMILSGKIDAPDFEADPGQWLAAEHYPPPMPWIDPQKDMAAIREALDAGLMSRRQAVAERGWSVESLDAEIAGDREREAVLGLNFGGSNADS